MIFSFKVSGAYRDQSEKAKLKNWIHEAEKEISYLKFTGHPAESMDLQLLVNQATDILDKNETK
jgi:hypothetical protein